MSDLKGIEVSDVLGLSQALVKLIDCIRDCVGTIYEPTHIKRMAKAKASEICLISNAINNNINLPSEYSDGKILIDATNVQELMARTGNRLIFQEMNKQQNIEAIVNKAYNELEHENEVSDEPIDKDWVIRFFNSIEDISNEEMQIIWGKILAGEIKHPNSYSLRTLEKLKNINKVEANLFQRVAENLLANGETYFLLSDKPLLNKHNIYFLDILCLEECGLISSQEIVLTFNITEVKQKLFNNSNILGLTKTKGKENKQIHISCYKITDSGNQLIQAMNVEDKNNYILECMNFLRLKHHDLTITAHKIEFIKGTEINYNELDILPSQECADSPISTIVN